MNSVISLWLAQAVNGLVLGNIYALLAAGLALIFGVAELINFAHGSVYMAGAYIGWLLIAQLGLPLWLALPLAALGGALLGVVLERFAVRPFRNSARIAPLLATLGAGMILDSLSEIIFTPNPRSFPPVLPAFRFSIGGVSLGVLDLVILSVSVTSAAGLFLFLKFSRTGRGLRAAALDPEAAQQMGVRVNRVNATAFALASALGALAGVLIGLYYNQISPAMGFQAGLKGFTACVLGGLGSVPAAMAGGLVLGLGESFGVALFGASARNLIAFSLLLVALFLRPNGLFSSAKLAVQEVLTGSFLPQARAIRFPWQLGLALAGAALLLPLVVHDPYVLQVLTSAWISALFAVSLTLVAGTAGIISLGHAGLLAIGAYASGLLTLKAGFSFPAAFAAAGCITAAIGTLLVMPALRLKGHYIAIATLGIGEIVNQIILNADSLTQGTMGLAGIPPPRLFGRDLLSALDFYWLSLAVLILGALVVAAVMASPLGRTVRGLREDEVAAQALGVRPLRYRMVTFAISAFFAGLAGALTAHLYTYISYDTFGSNVSVLGLTMVLLGGLGNIWGAVLGAVTLSGLPELLRFTAQYRWLAYGLILLVVLRVRPQGVLGSR
ncbi:MAG: ABC transporter permease [Holophaga sp.]|nr:ABC transporter permease [Holophaga sp.]